MQTLIVYDMNPECIEFYLIPASEDSDWVLRCNGHYINYSIEDPEDEAACNRLSDALCENLEYCLDSSDPLATKWAKYKVETKDLVLTEPTRVVHTGFGM